MSYGHRQEAASQALTDLVAVDHRGLNLREVDQILALRDIAWDTMQDRVAALLPYGTPNVPARPSPGQAAAHPVPHLLHVIDGTPRTRAWATPPSDLMTTATSNPAQQRWQATARELFLGNAELFRSTDRPWTTDRTAGWHLAADAADAVEALVVIDDQLTRSGILEATPATRRTSLDQRMVARTCSQVARWSERDPSVDLTTAGDPRAVLAGGPRVRLIGSPDTMPAAQQMLSRFLAGDQLSLRDIQRIATAQTRLADTFIEWARRVPGAVLIADDFTRRGELFRDLRVTSARLSQLPVWHSPLAMAQQNELLTAATRFQHMQPSRRMLHELNRQGHQVATELGRSLRQQTVTRQTLRMPREKWRPGLPETMPVNRHHEVHGAIRALLNDPSPAAPPPAWAAPIRRDALRTRLDQHPISATHSPRTPPLARDGLGR